MYYVLYSMINSDPGPSNWDISWSLLNIWVILGALERGRCVLLYPVRVLTKSTWFQSYMGGPPTFFRVILHRGAPGGAEKAKNKLFFEKLSNFLYKNGLCNHFGDLLRVPKKIIWGPNKIIHPPGPLPKGELHIYPIYSEKYANFNFNLNHQVQLKKWFWHFFWHKIGLFYPKMTWFHHKLPPRGTFGCSPTWVHRGAPNWPPSVLERVKLKTSPN